MSSILPDHLDLIAAAPSGIQKLRGLILELAVRGKLVPQDPSDEPASALLKRVAKERARLEAEGVCKKSRPALPIGEDKQPFALPESWEWSRLSAISLINPRNSADDLAVTSFVPMAMIGTGFEGAHSQEHRNWVEIKQGFTHFAEGDIGVAKITPCYENSKACVFANLQNGIGAGTTELHIVRPIGQTLVPRYVLAYLKAPMFLLVGETRMTGTAGQKRLPKEFLELNPFPLPPLAEQSRIVAKVDELMALCDRLEVEQTDAASAHAKLVETLLGTLTQSTDAADLAANWQRLAEHFDTLFTTESSLDALKQTILQLAVMGKLVPQDPNDEPASELLKRIAKERARLEAEGICKKSKAVSLVDADAQPFEVPEGWTWERIGNYVIQTDYGLSEKTFAATDGVPVLKMGDIQAGNVILGGQKAVPSTTEGLPYLFLEVGDLLYNRTNSAELVGKTGVFRGPAQQYSFASYLIRIRCAKGMVPPAFLNFAINAPMFREIEIVPHLKQQCGQANVNGTILRNMRIPVPPAAEQHRIVAKVDELMAHCDRLKADLAESRTRQARLSATLIESALQAA